MVRTPLTVSNPELAAEADGWDPHSVEVKFSDALSWRCRNGHQWVTRLANRIGQAGTGCPICANKKILSGYNDLQTRFPEIAAQAYEWDPKTVFPASHKKLDWQCTNGHIFSCSPGNRINGKGCPICANKKILAGFNDLQTTHPQLALETEGWDPREVFFGSNKKMPWRCHLGHLWTTSPNSRTGKNQTGCPVCANKKVLAGFNDLATTHPELAEEVVFDATFFIAGSHSKEQWKCRIDPSHIWIAQVKSRAIAGNGCPVCINQIVANGVNDMLTTRPDLASQAVGWDPRNFIAGTGKKLAWRCEAGHIWKATGADRVNGQGCPSCSNTGFDPSKRGWLYLLEHYEWGLMKVGITNVPVDRILKHERRGWQTMDVRGPMDGVLVRDWELSILNYIRLLGVSVGDATSQGKFDGYTETWLSEDFKIHSLPEIMELVRMEEFGDKS